MVDDDGSYRDELGAAHARIHDLEERLAASQQLFLDVTDSSLAPLVAERERLISETRKRIPLPKQFVVGGIGAGLFWLLILLLVGTGATVLTRDVIMVGVAFSVTWLVVTRRHPPNRVFMIMKVGDLTVKIEDIKRTRALTASPSTSTGRERVRVSPPEHEIRNEIEDAPDVPVAKKR